MNPCSKHGKKIHAFEALAFTSCGVGKTVSGKIVQTTIIPNLPHPYSGDDEDTSADQPSYSPCLDGRESPNHPLRTPPPCVASCGCERRDYVGNRVEQGKEKTQSKEDDDEDGGENEGEELKWWLKITPGEMERIGKRDGWMGWEVEVLGWRSHRRHPRHRRLNRLNRQH